MDIKEFRMSLKNIEMNGDERRRNVNFNVFYITNIKFQV